MKVRPIFAWYDLWVGVFADRAKRRVYVFPLPMLGVVVEWGATDSLAGASVLVVDPAERSGADSWSTPAPASAVAPTTVAALPSQGRPTP